MSFRFLLNPSLLLIVIFSMLFFVACTSAKNENIMKRLVDEKEYVLERLRRCADCRGCNCCQRNNCNGDSEDWCGENSLHCDSKLASKNEILVRWDSD